MSVLKIASIRNSTVLPSVYQTVDSAKLPTLVTNLLRCGVVGLLLSVCCVGCGKKKPTAINQNDAATKNAAPSNSQAAESNAAGDKKVAIGDKTDDADSAKKNKPSGSGQVAAPELVATLPVSGMLSASASGLVAQTWTTQRIIGMGNNGPVIVDLSVNVGEHSLDEVAKEAIDQAVETISKDLPKPWTWESFLEHPLVKSGWFGNLIPDEDQREQLISMYNKDSDSEVDVEELPAFFTRGLARGAELRFVDAGARPATMQAPSPWGALDTNQDNCLDKDEMSTIVRQASTYDLNGDRLITLPELRGMQPTPTDESSGSMSANNGTMLGASPAIAIAPDQPASKTAGKVKDHYTFLAGIPREQWPAWSDSEWEQLDADRDGKLTNSELEALVTMPPHVVLRARFPSLSFAATHGVETATIQGHASGATGCAWEHRIDSSGQLNGSDYSLSVNLTDGYSESIRNAVRTQLAAAMSNPMIEQFVRNQLQLGEDALKVIDADKDGQLSDDEFAIAWTWLTGIRGPRAIARWSVAESGWFQLGDRDGDGRMTAPELGKLVSRIVALDRDSDGTVTPSEIAWTVRLEISRSDPRMTAIASGIGQGEQQARPSDWFAAMDTNDDGFVSSVEFLGTQEDFVAYDSDSDGFISRTEGFPK